VWGLGEGFVAAVLLLAGGLKALQTASIAAALPVSIIMLLMTYGLVKSLNEDPSAVPASGETVAPDGTSLRGELRA
jgi:choline/glycine/proline betaine transport protein